MPWQEIIRLVARGAPIAERRQTIHRIGLPGEVQKSMAFPEVVALECGTQNCMMYRYRANGEFCGDTWHQSVEDAKLQAQFEYGNALGKWFPVPASESDVREYAIRFAAQESNNEADPHGNC
jgi:hypothetical protein